MALDATNAELGTSLELVPADSGGDPSSDPLYVFNHRLEKTTEVVPAEERVDEQGAPRRWVPVLQLCQACKM